jgi:hypothetical protein
MWCSPPARRDGDFGMHCPKQQHSWIFHPRQRGSIDFRATSDAVFDYASISAHRQGIFGAANRAHQRR